MELELEIVITEIINDYYSVDKEVAWLKCRTSSNLLVCFWGEFGKPNRNIVSIRHQELPLSVEILNPEFCAPTEYERSKYSISLSIPSDAYIQINPER